MRANKEYQLYRDVAAYLRLQYPKVMYHFDLTGLNLSKAQAGQMKAIQHSSGYPDLFICEPRGDYHGLFIELKAEGTRIWKADKTPASDHIAEQMDRLNDLTDRGYDCYIIAGFEYVKQVIDEYLNK
jgi:hypothetical protein